MPSQQSTFRWATLLALICASLVNAHSVITYPGYRGNNLHTNGTIAGTNGLGAAYENGSMAYPYGMQWICPCGGMSTSRNRTKWPVRGGALAFQPGWFPGHLTALIYVNFGLGEIPENMSHPALPPFQITGPTEQPVPLPAGINVSVGDKATIQLVEVAKHGAGLYDCVDIEFADVHDPDIVPVTRDNCFNSTWMSFQYMYTTAGINSAGTISPPHYTVFGLVPLVIAAVFGSFL
ncbi:hypothetical protein N7468_003471 [Penicillium chermesinum]|uniref:Copper acquisition factor BIM1-like domain-containing protein n=1 Tax=Penicillium chermesinum TaxID=63820 RepID=A0A9W9TRU5_9EURO|nr:uncharacterized protein N7468_003471 [Penicillium chermesinum]KAJ5238852.1 hypothetical protein N7468_003471 [Penicillium chermesinum]